MVLSLSIYRSSEHPLSSKGLSRKCPLFIVELYHGKDLIGAPSWLDSLLQAVALFGQCPINH